MGIKKANATNRYYVNYENDDVAYGAGFEFQGKTYYKLSEMKENNTQQENIQENNTQEENTEEENIQE